MQTGARTAQGLGDHHGTLGQNVPPSNGQSHQPHFMPGRHCLTAATDLQHNADCKQERSLPTMRCAKAAMLSLRQDGTGSTREELTVSTT